MREVKSNSETDNGKSSRTQKSSPSESDYIYHGNDSFLNLCRNYKPPKI